MEWWWKGQPVEWSFARCLEKVSAEPICGDPTVEACSGLIEALESESGFTAALALLEAEALQWLTADGASGDVEFWVNLFRDAARVLNLWADALEKRMGEELQVEAAETAAGVGRLQTRADAEHFYASEGARKEAKRVADEQDRLRRRRDLGDALIFDRAMHYQGRIAELEAETKQLRARLGGDASA